MIDAPDARASKSCPLDPAGSPPHAHPAPDKTPRLEPEALDFSDFSCLRCGRTPRSDLIVWSAEHNRGIHAASFGRAGPLTRICGGVVARKGDEWDARLTPGALALALPSAPTTTIMHYVRLGHPANRGNQSWRATPLCGTPARLPNWIPVRDFALSSFRTCPKCKRIHKKQPT